MRVSYRSSDSGLFAGIGCFAMLAYLAFIGFIGWAIIHFILKYW